MKPNRYIATKTYARPFAIALLVAIACALAIFTPSESLSSPQTAPARSLSAAPTGEEVFSWAKEAQRKLPPRENWDKARTKTETDRKLVGLVKKGHALINRVVERGAGMSAKEAASYDAQMQSVVEQLDKLTAGSGGGVAGSDTPKCFGGCDKLYPGKGGGKGWNRFWCKVGCLKILEPKG